MAKTIKRTAAFILAVIMVVSCGIIQTFAASTYTVKVTVKYNQTEARNMLASVNNFRTGSDTWYWNEQNTKKVYVSGLKKLTYDYDLEKTAMQRAAEIVLSMSHVRPDGSRFSTAFSNAYVVCGENIAIGYKSLKNSSSMFNGFLEADKQYKDQDHRRNMLDSKYGAVGFGFAQYGDLYCWVQEFSETAANTKYVKPNDSNSTMSVTFLSSLLSSKNVTLSQSSFTLGRGSTANLPTVNAKIKLKTTASSIDGINVTVPCEWKSSNTGVAKISEGKIVAVSAGTTKITASALGTSVSITVTVTGGKVKLNGLVKKDGVWKYYVNDKVDTSYTGMAKNEYGWWYVSNGTIDFSYTGMAKNEYGWWYINKGKLDTQYTGLAKNPYGWWYFKNGKIDRTYTGFGKNQYGIWFVRNGKVDTSFTGTVVDTNGAKWNVTKGKAVKAK